MPWPAQASAGPGAKESSSFQKASTSNRKLLPFLSILSQHFLFCFKKHSLSTAQPFPCPGQPQAQTHPQTSAFLLDGFLPTTRGMRLFPTLSEHALGTRLTGTQGQEGAGLEDSRQGTSLGLYSPPCPKDYVQRVLRARTVQSTLGLPL